MTVYIKYLAPFSFVLGRKEGRVSIPGRDSLNVRELLIQIGKTEPRFTKVAALENGIVLNSMSVLLEGTSCDLDATVPDGANIVIMSPVSGG